MAVEAGLRLGRFPILIITPKTPRDQWYETILRQTLGEAKVSIVDLDNPFPQQPLEWIITHPAYLRTHGPEFWPVNWQMVVVDEAHNFRNRNTQQYLALLRLKAYRKVCLTATPMHKSPEELWPMLNWIYPGRKEWRGYWPFRKRFVEEEKNWFGHWEFKGAKNEAELGQLLAPFTFRRTLADLEPNLPPRIITYERVEPPPELVKVHYDVQHAKDIIVDFDAEGNEHFYEGSPVIIANKLAEISYLRMVTSNPASKGFTFPACKQEWVSNYVGENPAQRVVVLCYYVETSEALGRELGVSGLHSKHRYLRDVVREFRAGKSNLLVGTYGSLGAGTDLPGADAIILVDLLYQRILFEQAIDRLYRMNVTTPKLVKVLWCPGTVDELLVEALQNNWTQVQLVMKYIAFARRPAKVGS